MQERCPPFIAHAATASGKAIARVQDIFAAAADSCARAGRAAGPAAIAPGRFVSPVRQPAADLRRVAQTMRWRITRASGAFPPWALVGPPGYPPATAGMIVTSSPSLTGVVGPESRRTSLSLM